MLHSGRLELMEGSLNDVAAAVGLPVVGDWTATGSDATRSSLPTPRAPTAFEQSAELREQLGFGVGGFRAGQQLQQELVIAGLGEPELVMDPAADRALQVMGAGERQHRPVPPVQAQRQQRQLPGTLRRITTAALAAPGARTRVASPAAAGGCRSPRLASTGCSLRT